MSIEAITKEKFLLYLKQRKSLDKEFGRPIVQKYEVKKQQTDASMERAKIRAKERYNSDEEYRAKIKDKARARYQAKKASHNDDEMGNTKGGLTGNTKGGLTDNTEGASEDDEMNELLFKKADAMRRSNTIPVNRNRFEPTPPPVEVEDDELIPSEREVNPIGYAKIRSYF
jgi:hypothetical protein